jgi:RimJ/RimL family protein N-acetyltransferase
MGEPVTTGDVAVIATTADQIESFHHALDAVARERKHLTMLEAFPLAQTRAFVLAMIERGDPHVVATAGDRVVGWCDISRHAFPSHAHRGNLGMGIVPAYRGQGLGGRLISAALDQARQAGFIRVELSVHADNEPAIALYKKVGFVSEGVHRRTVRIDDRFIDTISMAIMLDRK